MLNLNLMRIFLNIHFFESGTIFLTKKSFFRFFRKTSLNAFFTELKYDDDYFIIIEEIFSNYNYNKYRVHNKK